MHLVVLLIWSFHLFSTSDGTFSSPVDIRISTPSDMTISHLYHHPSVVLDAGSRLVMDCSLSGRTVHWEGKDSGTIELADVRSSDVGLYSCCDFLAPTECSSIHLFVRGDWVSAGLISRSSGQPIVLSLLQNRPAVIPCIPNAPETTLELKSLKTWKKIQDSGFGVTFDPTVGFSLQKATWTEEWVQMKCSTLSWSDTLDVVVYWTVAPELNGVRIDNPPNQVDSGSTLRLTCLSSGVHGSIKWLHQNKEVRTSQRVNIMIGPHESSEQRSSTLTVTNVSSRDAGLYTCRVFVLGSKELHISDSHEVRIATKNVPYEAITLQKELEGNVVVKVGQNLTLTASMEVPVKCFSQSHSWTRTRQMGGSNVTETLSEREALGTMYYTSDNLTRFQLEKTNIQPSDAGVYEFSLKACGRNGSISYTVTVVDRRAHVNGNAKSSVNLLVVVVFVVLLVVSMIHISCFVMKRNGAKRLHGWLDKSSVGFYDTSHMVDQSSQETGTYSCRMSDYESHFTGRIIAGSKLQLEPDVFGKGQYGYVYKGKLHDRDVAVKRLKSGENVKSLTEELRILDHLQSEGRHVHIVEMVGVVFCPEIMIVFEFCPRGNLLSFLQTIDFSFTSNAFAVRISKSLSTCNQGYYNFGGDMCDRPRIYHDHLMQYAAQISSAMQFLAAKMVIHRDVAARNVLVVSLDKVKLCDFGLSKMFNGDENVEYKTPGAKAVPYKWMSPESILGSFTTKSDVWAFGIFLWELFELGKAPYAYTNDPQEVFNFIDRGGRLPQPRECPLPLYQLMLRMWAGNPNKRPHFEEISEELARISKLVPAACDMFSDGDPGIDGT